MRASQRHRLTLMITMGSSSASGSSVCKGGVLRNLSGCGNASVGGRARTCSTAASNIRAARIRASTLRAEFSPMSSYGTGCSSTARQLCSCAASSGAACCKAVRSVRVPSSWDQYTPRPASSSSTAKSRRLAATAHAAASRASEAAFVYSRCCWSRRLTPRQASSGTRFTAAVYASTAAAGPATARGRVNEDGQP